MPIGLQMCEVIMSLKPLSRQNLIDLDMRFVGFLLVLDGFCGDRVG